MESQLLALFKMLPFRFFIICNFKFDVLYNVLEVDFDVLMVYLSILLQFGFIFSSRMIIISFSRFGSLSFRLWYWSPVTELVDEFTLITHLVFLLILVHHGIVTAI